MSAFDQAASTEVGRPAEPTTDTDVRLLVDGLTLPMNEDQLYRHQKSQFQYEGDGGNGSKSVNRSFIGLMQHKTNDLARFIEIKHRYWGLIQQQLPKQYSGSVKTLFQSEQKTYLFRSMDSNTEAQNAILNLLKPIFYAPQAFNSMP